MISVIGGYDDNEKYTVSCRVKEQFRAEEGSANSSEEDSTPEEDGEDGTNT